MIKVKIVKNNILLEAKNNYDFIEASKKYALSSGVFGTGLFKYAPAARFKNYLENQGEWSGTKPVAERLKKTINAGDLKNEDKNAYRLGLAIYHFGREKRRIINKDQIGQLNYYIKRLGYEQSFKDSYKNLKKELPIAHRKLMEALNEVFGKKIVNKVLFKLGLISQQKASAPPKEQKPQQKGPAPASSAAPFPQRPKPAPTASVRKKPKPKKKAKITPRRISKPPRGVRQRYYNSLYVESVQKLVNKLIDNKKIRGIPPLEVDGRYGPKTRQGVKKLQSLIGVSVDGYWGPKTSCKVEAKKLFATSSGDNCKSPKYVIEIARREQDPDD